MTNSPNHRSKKNGNNDDYSSSNWFFAENSKIYQPRFLLSLITTLFIGFSISACKSLPDIPHIEESNSLTESVAKLYQADNNKKDVGASDPVALNSQQELQNDELLDGSLVNKDLPDNNTLNSNTPNANRLNSNRLNSSKRHKTSQNSLTDNRSLTTIISAKTAANPQHSGYHPILNGAEAFAMRSMFSGMASKSIDVQYYIWHNDETGQLLLKDLWLAAERGVIVRLLLDDFNNNAQLDEQLRRFASHPNIAVRLVNPFAHRQFQALNYVTDMRRINHRMHNKSMTFDRQASIIGGRNVGDEYFSNSEGSQFADLDVLLVGDVLQDINDSFEQFWQSDLSYDIETLVDAEESHLSTSQPSNSKSDKTKQTLSDSQDVTTSTTPTHITTSDSLETQRFLTGLNKIDSKNKESLTYLLATTLNANRNVSQNSISVEASDILDIKFRWRDMTFLTDDVVKLTNSAPPDSHLVHQLRTLLGKPTEQLTIISSYFVPTADGVDTLIELAEQGVDVKILTNSFKATDVTAVHSGYEQWRKPMVQAGIKLYELKAIAAKDDRENKLWRARSQSSTSLHAKTFAVDIPQVFIGSYNVDPRSANINTEMGVLIDDSELAHQLHNAVTTDNLLDQAFEVQLDATGELQWRTIEDDKIVVYNSEPDVDMSDVLWMRFMSWLPIDWLL